MRQINAPHRLHPDSPNRNELVSFALISLGLATTCFVPAALIGHIPGNTDTWLAFDLAHYYLNQIRGLVEGGAWKPFAADPGFAFYGEPYPIVLLLLLVTGVTNSIVTFATSSAVLITTVNSTGTFMLARALGLNLYAAGFCGIAFATSTILIDNIDSGLIDCYGVLALTVGLALDRKRQDQHLLSAPVCVLLFLQAHMSVYVFVFTLITLAILFTPAPKDWRLPDWREARNLMLLVLSLMPLATGLLDARHRMDQGLLINAYRSGNLLDPDAQGSPPVHPLTWERLTTRLPAQPAHTTGLLQHVPSAAWPGLLVLLLSLPGWCILRSWRLAICALLFALISLGPHISAGPIQIPNPLWVVASLTGFASFLRIPIRAWSVTQLCLTLAAGGALHHLTTRRGALSSGVLTVVFLGVHVVEHVPAPPRSFAVPKCRPPAALLAWSRQSPDDAPLLLLPSKLGILSSHGDPSFFEYNREFVYMSWMPLLRRSLFNGAHGYFPRARIELQLAIDGLPAESAIHRLVDLGVRWVAMPACAVLPGEQAWSNAVASAMAGAQIRSSDGVRIFDLTRLRSPTDARSRSEDD